MSSDGYTTVRDDKGNTIKYKANGGETKFAVQKMSFVDDYGNKIAFDIQSSYWGDYVVSPMNSGPDMEPSDPRRDAAYAKLEADAKRYFQAHPDEKPQSMTDFIWRQAQKHCEKRQAEGKASVLEDCMIRCMRDKKAVCWEQITGEMSINASDEEVEKALARDHMRGALKKEAKAFNQSADRGDVSLANRVKAAQQNAQYTLRFKQRGDGSKTAVIEKVNDQDDRTMNEDEKNSLVRKCIRRLQQEGR